MAGADFIPKGIKYLNHAFAEDEQKHYNEALRLYMVAVEYFIAGLKCMKLLLLEMVYLSQILLMRR